MRNENIFEMSYYNTYYFSNIISNVISDSFSYLRKLHEFFENTMLISGRFEKYSVLHQFIAFIIEDLFYESIEDDIKAIEEVTLDRIKNKKFWIVKALKHHCIEHLSFQAWVTDYLDSNEHPEDLFYKYINEFLLDERSELIDKLTNDVFYILFLNRGFLLKFNYFVSTYISYQDKDDIHNQFSDLFTKSGVLKRVNIPQWVKNAVFFRDRGHCVFCNSDLTNLVSRLSIKNFDHIVPLGLGGTNDVSNIQLTCRSCNINKSDREIKTTNRYELWY